MRGARMPPSRADTELTPIPCVRMAVGKTSDAYRKTPEKVMHSINLPMKASQDLARVHAVVRPLAKSCRRDDAGAAPAYAYSF